jgi:hypothetical protein
VLGTNIAVTTGLIRVATLFWKAGILFWDMIMYSFFTAVVTRPDKPDLESGIAIGHRGAPRDHLRSE